MIVALLPSAATREPCLADFIRFLVIVGAIAALVYGGMIALVTFVKVQPREMTEIVEIPKAPK